MGVGVVVHVPTRGRAHAGTHLAGVGQVVPVIVTEHDPTKEDGEDSREIEALRHCIRDVRGARDQRNLQVHGILVEVAVAEQGAEQQRDGDADERRGAGNEAEGAKQTPRRHKRGGSVQKERVVPACTSIWSVHSIF